MAREIEIKLRIDDSAGLSERMAEIGAIAQPVVFEINTLFDRPDSSLRRSGCALRVRACFTPDRQWPTSATLTFKGPRAAGPLKDREELETLVASPETASAILARLGYAPTICYEKRRAAWRVDACELVLDELPGLGWFVEIEGPDAAAIRALQDRAGLSGAAPVDQSYVELAARHGQRDAQGVISLRF